MKTSAGQLKTIDTLCFPVETIRKVLIAAEQKKVLEQQVSILNDRIATHEALLRELNKKDSATVAGYDREIRLMKEQRAELESIIKRQRRNAFWSKIGGGLTTGILTYLLIIKK